ncbi:hypothetical protein GOE08_27025 [Sinorhizobium medicae]|nr:hypothetical protein [Sinorhizobium medicae]
MKAFFIRRAIVVAMRKPAPDRIPLSNMAKVRQRDYFAVYLGTESDRQRLVVTEVLEQGVKGFWFVGSGSDREERTISHDTLGDYEVLITHHFAELKISYFPGVEFLLKQPLRYELFWHSMGAVLCTKDRSPARCRASESGWFACV